MGDGMGEIGLFMDILGWVPPKHAPRQGYGTRVDSASGRRLPPQKEEAVLWGKLTMQNPTSTVLTKESGSGAIFPSAFFSHLDEGGSRKCYLPGISDQGLGGLSRPEKTPKKRVSGSIMVGMPRNVGAEATREGHQGYLLPWKIQDGL